MDPRHPQRQKQREKGTTQILNKNKNSRGVFLKLIYNINWKAI